MPITEQDVRKIRANDLSLPECREALAGFLCAWLREVKRVKVAPDEVQRTIDIYAHATQTGLVEMAQLMQQQSRGKR